MLEVLEALHCQKSLLKFKMAVAAIFQIFN